MSIFHPCVQTDRIILSWWVDCRCVRYDTPPLDPALPLSPSLPHPIYSSMHSHSMFRLHNPPPPPPADLAFFAGGIFYDNRRADNGSPNNGACPYKADIGCTHVQSVMHICAHLCTAQRRTHEHRHQKEREGEREKERERERERQLQAELLFIRPGHLGFAVLQCSFKSYFQANLNLTTSLHLCLLK